MAVYDVNDLIGARAGLGNVHTHLEAMRARFDLNDASNITSTSSTSLITMATTQISGVETNEIIVAYFWTSWSVNNTSSGLSLQLDIGGSTSQTKLLKSDTTGTSGDRESATIMHVATGLSGTVDIDVNWSTRGGLGTVYADSRSLIVFRLKNGAAA